MPLVWLAAAVAVVPLGQAQPVHELCAACHQTQLEDFATHPHKAKQLSCDACHGASRAHRESAGNRPPDRVAGAVEMPALCGTCHVAQSKSYRASRHWERVQARSTPGSANCATCHGAHAPRSPAAIENQCKRCHEARPSACQRPPRAAARVSCAGCHDPHSLARE